MTTPGGVPNLPQGALTVDTLKSNLQNMTGAAMKTRAVDRFPAIMDNSTGLSPALDFTPFGILTGIFAQVQSLLANADPADIQGPDDIPDLLLQFIEGLPVVGQFIDLLEAIMGNYTGDDDILNAVQDIFAPIRALMQQFAGIFEGFPNVDQITDGVGKFLGAFTGLDLTDPGAILTAITNAIAGIVGDIVHAVTGVFGGGLPDLTSWSGGLSGAISGAVSDVSDLVNNLLTAPASVLGNLPQSIITDLTGRLGGLDTGIQGAVDGLVNSLLGLGSFGWGQDDANDALAAQAAATAANAAAIAALQSNAGAGANGGQSFFHDFTIDANGALPGDFGVTYAGAATVTYGVAAGQSDWSGTPPTGATYRTADILYGGVTDSDYQLIGAVLKSTPGRGYIDYGAYPFSPHSYSQVRVPNAIRGRENAAGDTYVEALFGYDDATASGASLDANNQLQLACVVAGSRTNWVTTTYTPKANTAYYLQCGTAGGLRIYRVLEGGSLTPILTHTEVGTSSQVGASYRRGGAFTKSINSSGNGVTKSSPMSAFLLRDNLPATYIGSTGRAYRSTTSATAAINSATPVEFPFGTFDTVGFITNDLSYNQGTNEVHTVTITGAPTGGTWTYAVGGQTATGIARNVATATLATAIAALSSVGSGNVTVTGTAGSSYVITYGAAKAGVDMGVPAVTNSFTGGTAPTCVVARTAVGAKPGFVASIKGNYVVSSNILRTGIVNTVGPNMQPCVFVNGVVKRRGSYLDGRLQNTWVIPLEIGDRVSAGVATTTSYTFAPASTDGMDMAFEITGIPT